MTTAQIFILVGCIVLVDTVVVGALLAAGGTRWKSFAAYFPERPVHDGAQQRTWQTVRLGIFNWGFSFTIAADSAHVHLTPGPRIGKLMGKYTASIPLEAFAQVADVAAKPRSRFSRLKLKLANENVELPNWVAAGVAARVAAGTAGATGLPVMPRPWPPAL